MLADVFETAERTYPKSANFPLPVTRAAEWAPRLFWQRTDVEPFIPTDVCTSPVFAEVNRGRWVVSCECSAAQLASKTDRRFLCLNCLNEPYGSKWRPVIFPDDIAGIEAALRPRLTENANALPGESASQLLLENEVNGDGLDSA